MTTWNMDAETPLEATCFFPLPDGRYEEVKIKIENGTKLPPVKTGRIFRRPTDTRDVMQISPEKRAIIYNASNFTPEYLVLDIYGQDI